YLIGFTIFMVVAISASRLYLGVHYLSDIIAGWSIGATWLILCLNYFNLFIADKIALEDEVKNNNLKEKESKKNSQRKRHRRQSDAFFVIKNLLKYRTQATLTL